MVTLVNMVDLANQPATEQVWILPGTSQDFEDDGEFSGWLIEDYLRMRAVLLASNLAPTSAKALIEDVKAKFERVGIVVVIDYTAND